MSDERKSSVSLDAVYTQMYTELRRYRDYELTVATWFTSILLAILGAVVAGKYVAKDSPLGVALERCPSLKVCLMVVPVFIAIFGAWSIIYAMRRYGELRKWVTATLEPKIDNFTPDQSCCPFFTPGTLMCVVLLFLGIFTAILIFHQPSALGG